MTELSGEDARQQGGNGAGRSREASKAVAVQGADNAYAQPHPGTADDASHESADNACAGESAADMRSIIGRNDR